MCVFQINCDKLLRDLCKKTNWKLWCHWILISHVISSFFPPDLCGNDSVNLWNMKLSSVPLSGLLHYFSYSCADTDILLIHGAIIFHCIIRNKPEVMFLRTVNHTVHRVLEDWKPLWVETGQYCTNQMHSLYTDFSPAPYWSLIFIL